MFPFGGDIPLKNNSICIDRPEFFFRAPEMAGLEGEVTAGQDVAVPGPFSA